MDVWKTIFLLGRPTFRGYVSFILAIQGYPPNATLSRKYDLIKGLLIISLVSFPFFTGAARAGSHGRNVVLYTSALKVLTRARQWQCPGRNGEAKVKVVF